MNDIVLAYVRTSTARQNIERQKRNVAVYNPIKIYEDRYTGTKLVGCRALQRMLKDIDMQVKAGKQVTVVFDSVSRMSRNAEDGFNLYMSLYEKGVNLIFVNEPLINTSVYRQAMTSQVESTGNEIADIFLDAINKAMRTIAKQQIKMAFEQAEKEVMDLRKRTVQGLETARLNGKQIGQKKGAKFNIKKKAPVKEQIKKYSKDFDGNLKDVEVIKLVGVARNTYYKYKKELLQEIHFNS